MNFFKHSSLGLSLAGIVLLGSAAAQTARTSTPWTMLRLPDTGQTTRSTQTPGEDSFYTINPPSYKVNGDGTVNDLVTGLQWQQTDGGEMGWAAGVAYCKALDLGGKKDWRLPNVKELESISSTAAVRPSIDQTAFPNTPSALYWSSTTLARHAERAWTVSFSYGVVSYNNKTDKLHVRAVRGGTTTDAKAQR